MRSPGAVAVPFLACLLFVLLVGAAAAAPSKGIPVKTPAQLQAAFGSVPDGGFIDLAPGVYLAPAKGFNITNPRKGFTVRAVGGAVMFDGQNKVAILRYRNGDRSKGKLLTFQGITFRNGASVAEGDSGGVTLNAAEARFVDCNFVHNSATGKTTGGGSLRVYLNSAATLVRTNVSMSSSKLRGGAVEVVFSTLTVQGGLFADNHVNVPGHQRTSPGGGIYALDSTVTLSDARFERNEAGWTGGAIYAFGHWTDPVSTPKSLVTIIRSTFLGNRAIPDACCLPTSPTTGGAVHVEDQSTLKVFGSQFLDNAADIGGALEGYRAIIEVTGSLFIGNRTPLVAGRLGVGGAVSIASNDSAADGTVNRRSASLTVTDSLFEGGVVPPATPANSGGCLAAEGDWSRLYGLSIPSIGTAADNRAPVQLHRVTFAGCNGAKSAAGGGVGGAVSVSTVDLLMDDSLIFDSNASGDGGSGGALSLQRESNAVITGSTFAHNAAQQAGGALFLTGSTVQVSGSRFLGNSVSGSQSRGSAIYTIPQLGGLPPRDIGGLVSGCVFSENAGIPIWDVDPQAGPFNEMRYDNNQFYSASFGSAVYFNSSAAQGGADLFTLNSLVIFHSGRPDLDKGNGNSSLFSPPQLGTLLASPPSLGTGAPGATATFMAYAWSGGFASLSGQPLASRTGLQQVSTAGVQTLSVNGSQVDSAEVAASPSTVRRRHDL